jgi:hypothetical protein
MYAFFQKEGLQASADGMERFVPVLGHPPRSFEAFARETAAAWVSA